TRFDCDWSSDVCSSDLSRTTRRFSAGPAKRRVVLLRAADAVREMVGGFYMIELRRRLILLRPRAAAIEGDVGATVVAFDHPLRKIGRASCRERVRSCVG